MGLKKNMYLSILPTTPQLWSRMIRAVHDIVRTISELDHFIKSEENELRINQLKKKREQLIDVLKQLEVDLKNSALLHDLINEDHGYGVLNRLYSYLSIVRSINSIITQHHPLEVLCLGVSGFATHKLNFSEGYHYLFIIT